MTHRLNSLLLLLAGCASAPEAGIDRTFIRGTVTLPPGDVAEAEAAQGDNDDFLTPEDIGYITTRYTILSGSCLEFANIDSVPTGDVDHYVFSPLNSGPLDITMTYAVAEPAVTLEAVQYSFQAYNAADPKTVLAGGSTDGSGGLFETTIDVTAGETYIIAVGGLVDREGTDGAYSVTFSGFDPNGTIATTADTLEPGWGYQDGEIYTADPTRFIIGAYSSDDASARGLPLGGSDVPEFTFDEETLTWSGDYEITYVYGSVLPEVEDTGEFAVPEITVGLDQVYLFAGTFPSLNAGLTAGTFYSSTPLLVSLSEAKTEEYEAGWIGSGSVNKVLEADALACDLVQPKQYGWAEADAEPNDFADIGDGYAVVDTAGAQAMPEATGNGFIDTITGTLDFTSADPSWLGVDVDAYAITVPESLDAYITMGWADANYDLDLHVYLADGTLAAAGWADSNANPEDISFAAEAGVAMEPGETYYITAMPWSGPEGAVDYTIEIEWLAP